MVHLDRDFNIVGIGKGLGKPRNVKGGKLSKAERARAVVYVQAQTGMNKRAASKFVTQAFKKHRIIGGSFWDTLANIGKSVVGAIPGVGAFAKEGIDALQHHRAYDAGKAAKEAVIDTAFSLIPGGNVVKGIAKAGVKHLLRGKKRVNSGPSKTTAKLQSLAEASAARKAAHEKRLKGGCGTCPHCGGETTVSGGARRQESEPQQVRRPVKSRCGGMSKRGKIVAGIMRETGLSLPDASRYVKENGLYTAR